MNKNNLHTYIKKERKKGFSDKNIKHALLKANYKKIEINDAFSEITKKPQKKPTHLSILYVASIIIVLLIVFVIINNPRPTKEITLSPIIETPSGIEEKTSAIKEILENNITFLDESLRKPIALNEETINLLKEIRKKGDTTDCEKIQHHIYHSYCYDFLLTDDECSFLSFINEDTDSCFLELSQTEKDIILCDLINNSELKQNCINKLTTLANSGNNIDLCSGNEECLLNYSISKNNCNFLKDEELKARCVFSLAITNKDSRSCESLKGTEYYEECNFILSTKEEVIALCDDRSSLDESVPEEQILNESADCKIVAAIVYDIIDYCNGDFCIGLTAMVHDKQEYCEKMSESNFKTICIAKTTTNKNLCDSITDINNNLLCNALLSEDLDLCNAIEESDEKDLCDSYFEKVAKNEVLDV